MEAINLFPLFILFFLLLWIFKSFNDSELFIVKLIFVTGITELGFSCIIYENFIRGFQLYEFLGFIAFLLLIGSSFRKNIPYSYLMLVISVMISNIYLFFDPADTLVPPFGIVFDILLRDKSLLELPEISMRNLFLFLRVLMIYPFLIILRDFSDRQYSFFSSLINSYGLFYIVILLIEFSLKNLGLDLIYENIFTAISGQDASLLPGHLVSRGGLRALHGFVAEPSHLAYALIIPLFYWANIKGSSFKFIALVFFLMASGSYRCLVLSALGVVIYFSNLNFEKLSLSKVLLCIIILLFTLSLVIFDGIFSYYTDSLLSMLNGKFNAGSQSVRFNTFYYAVDAFFSRPFFGVGLGSINIPSAFFGVIGSLGLMGLLSYFLILKNCLHVNFSALNTVFLFIILFFSFDTKIIYSIGVYIIFLSLNKNIILFNRNYKF
jgi:hypothetical protein